MSRMNYGRATHTKKDLWFNHDQFKSYGEYATRNEPTRGNRLDERVALYEGDNEELLEFARICLFGGSLTVKERGRAGYLLGRENH